MCLPDFGAMQACITAAKFVHVDLSLVFWNIKLSNKYNYNII